MTAFTLKGDKKEKVKMTESKLCSSLKLPETNHEKENIHANWSFKKK